MEIFDRDKGIPLHEWLSLFEAARHNYGWSDDVCANVAHERTRGRARKAILRLRGTGFEWHWPSIVAQLYREFHTPAAIQAAQNQLETIVQLPTESVREFGRHLENLTLQAYPPLTGNGSSWDREGKCLVRFRNGLYDPSIQEYLQGLGPSTFQEALDVAMAKEERMILARQSTNQQVLATANSSGGRNDAQHKEGEGKKKRNRNRKKGGESGKPTLTTSGDSRDLSPASVRKLRDFLAQRDASSASNSSRDGGYSTRDRKPQDKGKGNFNRKGPGRCTGKCFRCGKQGHYKRNCRVRGTFCVSEAFGEDVPCGDGGSTGCQCACRDHVHFADSGDEREAEDALNEEGD